MSTTAPGRHRRASARRGIGNHVVLGLLCSALAPLAGGRLCVLRYRARRGGEVVEFPVGHVRDGDHVLVMAGRAARKTWWRHFRAPAPVEVRLPGGWSAGVGRVLHGAEREAALAVYRHHRPHVPAEAPLVAIDLPPAEPLRGKAFAWSWFWIVTLAEFAGFAVPAVVGAFTAGSAPAVAVPVLLAAGAVEGAALGCGQALVLRHALPALPGRRWIAATSAGAVVAYLAGTLPAAAEIHRRPPVQAAAAAVALGLVLLASLGTAQWPLLRSHLSRAWRWIPVTAAAWLAGLGVFLAVTMPLWHDGQALSVTVLIGAGGGLLMAATTSAITGLALARLLASGG
ncbi:hypothetical protein ACFWQL_16955 [Amycolatopsis thermoflava]|uniref:hypothetical protein n=1 Tax=Amycolatopsis thermoflava TaxID=84480 RepID=UPI00364C816C